jgi:sialic acid synthase SpsE
VDIGEPIVAALEAVGEVFVIEAEKVEDGGLEVVDVDFVFDARETHFIRGAVIESALHAAACHEDGEAVGIMVAAEDLGSGTIVAERHVMLRRPGTGILARDMGRYMGRQIVRSISRGTPLRPEDFALTAA